MTMDVEHVAADEVATTVRRRYSLPPIRQVGLRHRVSAPSARRGTGDAATRRRGRRLGHGSGPAPRHLGNSS